MNLRRRAIGTGALALTLSARSGWAQLAGMRRIGLLSIAEDYTRWPEWRAFVDELARLGYVEGRGVVYVVRHAGTYDEPQSSQRLFTAAAELVAERVDIIYTVEVTATALAAQGATQSIAIIFDRSWFDPVGIGLVASLARPGRNVTGNAVLGVELEGKAIEALVATVGTAAPSGVVQSAALRTWPNYARLTAQRRDIERALGVKLEVVDADSLPQLGVVLERLGRQGVRAVKIDDPDEFAQRREEVAAMFAGRRMAAVSTEPAFVRAGLALGIGWDIEEIARRSAHHASRILRGASPGDLPVERATKFGLAVNRRTARAIGLVLPPALLARANEVIE